VDAARVGDHSRQQVTVGDRQEYFPKTLCMKLLRFGTDIKGGAAEEKSAESGVCRKVHLRSDQLTHLDYISDNTTLTKG
jgi:hypothetical protein